MQKINYLYDQYGKKTAMLIDLSDPNLENVFKNPLNEAQQILLQTTSIMNNQEILVEFQQLLAKFLAEKLLDEGDLIWEERNYSIKTFEEFVEND